MTQNVVAPSISVLSETGGNSGSQSYDYDLDKIVGEGAEKIWKRYSDRQAKKHAILAENPGKTGYDLVKVRDEYIIADKKPLQERKALRDLSEKIKKEGIKI